MDIEKLTTMGLGDIPDGKYFVPCKLEIHKSGLQVVLKVNVHLGLDHQKKIQKHEFNLKTTEARL